MDANKTDEEKAWRRLHKKLQTIPNKSWKRQPTKQQLYAYRPPITKTIKIRRTRYAGHSWRSRDELMSNLLPCPPSYERAKAGKLARTYIQQLGVDTRCSPEDLMKAMNDREGWWGRVWDIRADGTTRWWYWLSLTFFCIDAVKTSGNVAVNWSV